MRKRTVNILVALAMVFSFMGVTVAQTSQASAAGWGCVANRYGVGSYSTCVTYIQQFLRHFNSTNVSTDGYYGSQTYNNVVKLQQTWGLYVDGTVGPQTWKFFCTYARAGSAYPYPWSAYNGANCASLK